MRNLAGQLRETLNALQFISGIKLTGNQRKRIFLVRNSVRWCCDFHISVMWQCSRKKEKLDCGLVNLRWFWGSECPLLAFSIFYLNCDLYAYNAQTVQTTRPDCYVIYHLLIDTFSR